MVKEQLGEVASGDDTDWARSIMRHCQSNVRLAVAAGRPLALKPTRLTAEALCAPFGSGVSIPQPKRKDWSMNSIQRRLKTDVWPYAKTHLIQMVRNMAAEFAAGGGKAR